MGLAGLVSLVGSSGSFDQSLVAVARLPRSEMPELTFDEFVVLMEQTD